MSLFQNSGTSFGPAVINLHQPRPVLKRSQTPYRPSADSKRRRTSPTGAFSRLSLSPTSTRPAETREVLYEPHRLFDSSSSSILPTTINQRNNIQPNNRLINESFSISNNFQFGLNKNQFSHTLPHQSSSASSPKETKMRSTYSAYDIDSNRIFIESLSDGERSPTPSIQLEGDQTQEPSKLELSPNIAHQLSAHHHNQRHLSANILLNSYQFISDPDSSNDQQLVLYRKPVWPVLPSNDQSLVKKLKSHADLSEPQIVEINDLHDVNIDVLDSNQDESSFNNHLSSNPIDSMELD